MISTLESGELFTSYYKCSTETNRLFPIEPFETIKNNVTINDDAILEGSNADRGAFLGELAIEIWDGQSEYWQLNDVDEGCIQVYPLDGLDKPVIVKGSEHIDLDDDQLLRDLVARVMTQRNIFLGLHLVA